MPHKENWASACTNPTWESEAQNGGNLMLTGLTVGAMGVVTIIKMAGQWREFVLSQWRETVNTDRQRRGRRTIVSGDGQVEVATDIYRQGSSILYYFEDQVLLSMTHMEQYE